MHMSGSFFVMGEKDMKCYRCIKRIMVSIPMLLVMIIIYIFSAGTGEESGSLSLSIAEWVSDTFLHIEISIEPEVLHLPIRKIAHMTEYAILAITAMWAFYDLKKRYVIAFLVSVLYAMTDEGHQLFVDGRAGSAVDVLIDSVGVFLGLVLYKVIVMIREKY